MDWHTKYVIFPYPMNAFGEALMDKNKIVVYEVSSTLMNRYHRFNKKYILESGLENIVVEN